jgi:hypothetical protein
MNNNISKLQDQRITKGFLEKFVVVEKKLEKNNILFKIKGSTGNIYTINITYDFSNIDNHFKIVTKIVCDCPDNTYNHSFKCKHCCFILYKLYEIDYKQYPPTNGKICNVPISFNSQKDGTYDVVSILFDNFCDLTTEYDDNKSKSIYYDRIDEQICYFCYESISDDIFSCSKCSSIYHKKCIEPWIAQHPEKKSFCEYCRNNSLIDGASK